MKSVSPELAAAIAAPERVLVPRLSCDWDGDGFNGRGTVDDLSRGITLLRIDQTLTSNVPSVAQPVAGAAVARLVADVEQGHLFGTFTQPTVRNITTSTAATGTGVVSVGRGIVRPGDLVLVWFSHSGDSYSLYTNGMNATWNQLFLRGDINSTTTHHTTGHLLSRRVGITQADVDAEPSTYTFTANNLTAWVAHCVVIAGGYTPGIHALTQKGVDPLSRRDVTYGLLQGRRITTTLDHCLLLGFFAGYSGAGGGATWTADPPATKLADTCSTNVGSDNVATCITQITDAAAGSYTLGATISAATEPGVVATVALAPLITGDETQNAAWTYSELNPTSQLAGKSRLARPITATLDVATAQGTQSVPLFSGQSLGIDVSSRARRATLTALDNRELMRRVAQDLFPIAVLAENPLKFTGETLPLFPGLEATWMVSYIFSYCRVGQIGALTSPGAPGGDGFFASPNIRPSNLIHVPCHGSLEPFQGSTNYAYQQDSNGNRTRVTFGPGPWVASTTAAPTGGKIDAKWRTSQAFFSPWKNDTTGNSSSAGRIEVYLQRSVTAASGTATVGLLDENSASNFIYLDLLATGVLQLRLSMNSGITRTITGPTFPTDTAWHAVGVHWDSTTGVATFKVDSTVTTAAFATFTNGSLSFSTNPDAYATLTNGARMAELQMSGAYPYSAGFNDGLVIHAGDPFAWDNFTPTAFIDQSVNVMDSTLAIDAGVDCYGLLTELADAEFAAVYFDSLGYPHYRTRASDVSTTGQTVQRTLTTLNSLKDLDYQSGTDQLANSVQVPFTPIVVTQNTLVWQSSNQLRVPAHAGITVQFSIGVTLPGVRDAEFTDVFTVGNANTAPDGSGTVVSGSFAINGVSNGVNGTVYLLNDNSFDVWFVDVSGNPTASWKATIVKSDVATLTAAVTDDDSIRAHGLQVPVNGVPASKWRQRQSVANALGRLLIADLAEPGPVLTNVKIMGDPRLELGDLVRFVDKDGLGFDGSYRLVGVSPSYSPDEGFTQTLTARRVGCGVAIWDTSYWDDCSVWGV